MSKISVEFIKKDGLYKSLLSFSEEEFSKAQKETVKKVGSSRQIQGFRKGKAPEHLLLAKFSKEIEEKTMRTLSSQSLPEIRKKLESDIHQIYSIQKIKELKVELIFDCMPYVKLCNLNEAVLYDDEFFVPDDHMSTELFRFQLLFGQKESKRTKKEDTNYDKNDLLILDVEAISEDAPEGYVENDVEFLLGLPENNTVLKDHIFKNKPPKNEEFQVTDEVYNKKRTLVVKIKEAYSLELPELNDEFISKVRPDCKNVEDLKKLISKMLIEQADTRFYQAQLKYALDVYQEKSEFFISKPYLDNRFEEHLEELKTDISKLIPDFMEEYKKKFEQKIKHEIIFTNLLDQARKALKYSEEEAAEDAVRYMKKNRYKYQRLLEPLDNGGQKKNLNPEHEPLMNEFTTDYARFCVYRFLKQEGIFKKGASRSVNDLRQVNS